MNVDNTSISNAMSTPGKISGSSVDLDSFPMMHVIDCPTRQQINVNKFTIPHRIDGNSDHRRIKSVDNASSSKGDPKSGQLELTRMPRVSQVDASNSGASWGQKELNQPSKNNNKSDEP